MASQNNAAGTKPSSVAATTIASVVALLIALILLLLWVSFGNLTNRESGLLGTMLTIASSAFGAFLTHIYAQKAQSESIAEVQEQHNKNLKTYALKASEKVNNLSKELHRLVVYLEEELNENSYATATDELLAKEERIQSAVHIIQTLRSMNDTSLSDWQGVIGDELAEKRAEEETREEEIIGLLKRIEALSLKTEVEELIPNEYMFRQMDTIRKEIRNLGASTTNISLRPPRKEKYESIAAKCPQCESPISYRQRPKEGTSKAIKCRRCAAHLLSKYKNGDFELCVTEVRTEGITCPNCTASVELELEDSPGAGKRVQCQECSSFINVSRTNSGLRSTLATNGLVAVHALTEDVIESVKNALPTQPWPKGVHLAVAKEINVPHQIVQKAINALIQRGDVHDQINGVICTTAEKIAVMREIGKNL